MSRNRDRSRQTTQSQPQPDTTVTTSYDTITANDEAAKGPVVESSTDSANESFASSTEPTNLAEKVAAMNQEPDLATLYNQASIELVAKPVEIPVGQVLPPAAPHDPYELPLSASPSSRLTVTELKHYIERMSSSVRMPNDEGGALQSQLYHILVQAVNTRAEDFDAVFNTVARLIRDNLKGVFSDANVHRYTPYVTLPAKAAAHFRYLVSVLTALVDPELRALAARQTNLDQAFRTHNIKEESRQRVLNFFNL